MDKPLVSVVVVSYNHAKYIRENLDSIKAQTYQNIELIVADDASQDDSVEVFEQWLSENNYPARKNFHKKNTGLATMLNECTEMLTGKYVKFIAADDFLHPESIAKCLEKLEELGEEFGMVFTDTFAVDGKSEVKGDFADYSALGNIPKEQFRKELIKANRIAALTVLLRTDTLKSTGKYDSKFLAEDYYRWLKINEKYFIAYIDEKLAYYRLHGENISIARQSKLEEEALQLQMMFDRNGDCRNLINSKVKNLYQNHKLSADIKNLYGEYPWHIKRIKMAIDKNIPYWAFSVINKIL